MITEAFYFVSVLVQEILQVLRANAWTYVVLLVYILAWLAFGHRHVLERYFRLACVLSTELALRDWFGVATRSTEYVAREAIDKKLDDLIASGDNLLVLGPPGSGKRRAVYEALRRATNPVYIWLLRHDWPPPGSDMGASFGSVAFPALNIERQIWIATWLARWSVRRKIVVIDGLGEFAASEGCHALLTIFDKLGFQVVATCCSGEVYQDAVVGMATLPIKLHYIFPPDSTICFKKVPEAVAEEIASRNGLVWADARVHFDGTIPSIFLAPNEGQRIWAQLGELAQRVFVMLRQLDVCGLISNSADIPLCVVHLALERVAGIRRGDILKALDELGRIPVLDLRGGLLRINTSILRSVNDATPLEVILRRTVDAFRDDEAALVLIGHQCRRKYDLVSQPVIGAIAVECYTRSFALQRTFRKKLWLGQTYARMKKFDEAVKIAAEVIDDRRANKRIRSLAFCNMGFCLVEKRKVDIKSSRPSRIVRCFRESLELNPGLTEAWYRLGCFLAQLKTKRLRVAEKCLSGAATQDPHNCRTMISRFSVLKALGRYEDALLQLADIERLDNESDERVQSKAWPHHERAEIFKELGRFSEARDSAAMAVTHDFRDLGARNTLVYMELLVRQTFDLNDIGEVTNTIKDALQALDERYHSRYREKLRNSVLSWLGRRIKGRVLPGSIEVHAQVSHCNMLLSAVGSQHVTFGEIKQRIQTKYPDAIAATWFHDIFRSG